MTLATKRIERAFRHDGDPADGRRCFDSVQDHAYKVAAERDRLCRGGWLVREDLTVATDDGVNFRVYCVLDEEVGFRPIWIDNGSRAT